ncbi:MAG TPA: sodium:alanine symporter family protein [Balneolaceae bacterium]|nr:sodium:alanine symporter family protein [Balneolaceae bacterium]
MDIFQKVVDWIAWLVWEWGIPGEWLGFDGNQTIPFVVIILVGVGIWLTLRMGFVQLRRFGHGVAVTTGKYDDPDEPGDVSHFQALTTALSATVGIGNIAGVAIAIHWGGPGALFWMWVTAFLGMATKFTEVTLAQEYRDHYKGVEGKEDRDSKLLGTVSGGPMYYIQKGLGQNWKWMAVLSAVLLGTVAFFTGNAVQANTVAVTMSDTFGINIWITGIITAGFVAVVILGGISRIGKVTSILAPGMAAIYVLGGLAILAFNYEAILPTIGTIFSEAFNPTAGIAGTGVGAILVTMMWGVRRGIFSNESGMGSAPIAHSAAQTDEPVSEGVVALLEPFIDTIVICSITGLAILMTGVWDDTYPTQIELDSGNTSYIQVDEATGTKAEIEGAALSPITIENGVAVVDKSGVTELAWYNVSVPRIYTACEGICDDKSDLQQLFSGTIYPAQGRAVAEDGTEYFSLAGMAVQNGATLTIIAFERGLAPLGDWGGYIVIFCVLLFAISTAISWNYYGNRCALYLFGEKAILPYNAVYVAMHLVGAVTALSVIWSIGDIFLGLVILPNLLALTLLSGKVREKMRDYFKREPWHENYEVHKRIVEEKKKGKSQEELSE